MGIPVGEFFPGNLLPGRTIYPINLGTTIAPNTAPFYHDDSSITCEEIATYGFKNEASEGFQKMTLRSIGICYLNMGLVNITCFVTGEFETRQINIQLGNPNPVPSGSVDENYAYYGAQPPAHIANGLAYIAYLNFQPLTTTFFQIFLQVPANDGPFELIRLWVIGEGEEISR